MTDSARANVGLDAWIDVQALGRAVLVLLPVVVAGLVTGDPLWLRAALVTISCFVATERANLAPVGVVLHGIATVTGFLVLFFAQLVPAAFVVSSAVMAAAVMWLSGLGKNLRSLGSWTFIPALYVAVETAEGCPRDEFVARALLLLPYLAASVVPVVILSVVDQCRSLRSGGVGWPRALGRLRTSGELGDRIPFGEAMIAVGLAVATVAWIVEWRHLQYGEWVVWSAVSVVTGDVASAQRKLRDRLVGAAIGVPVGIGLGFGLPHHPITYGLAVLAGMLTVVSFRKYVLGFAARCAFIACAMVVANDPAVAPSARVINVVLGGVIGMLYVLAIHLVADLRHRKAAPRG